MRLLRRQTPAARNDGTEDNAFKKASLTGSFLKESKLYVAHFFADIQLTL